MNLNIKELVLDVMFIGVYPWLPEVLATDGHG
jgi:hypothetical protein